MPLPSAVQKIAENAERQAVEQGMKGAPGEAPAGEQPAAQPTPAQPPIAVAPEPGTPTDNWEDRYKNLRAKRDETIEQQGKQVVELQQMVAKSQERIDELLVRLDKATAQPEPAIDPKDVKEAAYQEWLNKIPKRFIDDYDETWLRDQFELQQYMAPNVQPSADPDLVKRLEAAEQRLKGLDQVQQKTAREQYEDDMDAAFPNDEWINLTSSSDESWIAFCNEVVSPVDTRSYGQVLEQAHNTADSRSAIWVLAQFKTQRDGQGTDGDAGNPLDIHLTPEGGSGGDPIQDLDAKTESFTATQVNDFYKQAAMDTGKPNPKYSPEEAKAIEMKIIAAQGAGKILPG